MFYAINFACFVMIIYIEVCVCELFSMDLYKVSHFH